MKKNIYIWLIFVLLRPLPAFDSYHSFRDSLQAIGAISDPLLRSQVLGQFWSDLKSDGQIPFRMGDSVAFLYRGSAAKVHWAGDMNGWNFSGDPGKKIGAAEVWMLEKVFPQDSRLDYKIVLNENNWIPDPDNPLIQWSGFGPNSELRMPAYSYPQETVSRSGITRGTLSGNNRISSYYLGYTVQYMVYKPAGTQAGAQYPVLFVTDGHEYSDDRLGSMKTVLDNLIADHKIEPLIVVFIDPRNPDNLSENRRMSELNMNPKYADFICKELIPTVELQYPVYKDREKRGILGTSMGGLNAAYLAISRPEFFSKVMIQSPAFGYNQAVFDLWQNTERQDLTIYMSSGVINDTEDAARQMRDIMLAKDYPLQYKEVNEGHSWGNWRALLDEALSLFPAEPSALPDFRQGQQTKPEMLRISPNPGNDHFILTATALNHDSYQVQLFNNLGQYLSGWDWAVHPGQNRISLSLRSYASGLYHLHITGRGLNHYLRLTLAK